MSKMSHFLPRLLLLTHAAAKYHQAGGDGDSIESPKDDDNKQND